MNLEDISFTKSIFKEFQNYHHELVIDSNEAILKSQSIIAQETIIQIGKSDIYYIIKSYQKIIANTIYFNESKIIKDYLIWLYRIYHYRGVDLEFFIFLNDLFKTIISRYIDGKIFIPIKELFESIIQNHEALKEEALKVKALSENNKKSTIFADIILKGDEKQAYEMINKESSDLDQFLIFYKDTIANAMKKIGWMWETQEVSVAKEHIASNTLENVVLKTIDSFEEQEDKGITILTSSAPEELHSMGLKIASKILLKLGFTIINLGVNIPKKDIHKAIDDIKPDIIILSATQTMHLVDILFTIEELIQSKAIYSKNFKIGIAGGAFDKIILPTKTMKADFYIKDIKDFIEYMDERL